MRSISRRLELPLGVHDAFALLHTPSAMRKWWSAARVVVAARTGGLWVAAWGDDEDAPEYITSGRVLVWDPPHTLRFGEFEYFTREGGGLPFTAELETEFSVQPDGAGSLLRVHQTGFPEEDVADAFFTACEQGWAATFEGIRRYVADGGTTEAGSIAAPDSPHAPLTTVAYRVHHVDAMVAFYSEAFGARFRAVATGGMQSQFGELPGLTLKFVPIRESADFDGFPVHQPGFDVPDVARVVAIAVRHGGRVQNDPISDGARIHAAVRDPDGNTIELYGPR